MRTGLSLFLLLILGSPVSAQLFNHTYSGTPASCPTLGNESIDLGTATSFGFERASKLQCTAASNAFGSKPVTGGWGSSQDADSYISTYIAAEPNYYLQLTSVSVVVQNSATSNNVAFGKLVCLNEVGNVVAYTDFSLLSTMPASLTLSLGGITSVSGGSFSFRIYFWGPAGNTSTVGNGVNISYFFINGAILPAKAIINYSTGAIGAGTVTPSTKLHVKSDSANTSGLRLENLTSSSPGKNGKHIGVDSFGNVITMNADNTSTFYTADGSITGNRTVTGSGGNLAFNNFGILSTGANVGIGTSSPASRLTLQDGGMGFLLGADSSATTLTNAKTKYARLAFPHYTNSEEPAAMLFGMSSSGVNQLSFGGGSNLLNAATQIDFFTAGNQTTVSGTSRMRITSGGLIGLGSAAPTHTLTFPSTSTGIAYYNTTDQTTNYERYREYWSSNIYNIRTEAGGTGSGRDLLLGTTSRTLRFSESGAGGFFQFTASTSGAGLSAVNVGGSLSASSGTNAGISVSQAISQTGTAGYTGLLINATETTVGTGQKNLILGQVGALGRFRVSNTGDGYFAGNLGVGTDTPTAKLHIVGGLRFVTGGQGVGKVLKSDSLGNATWQPSDAALTVPNNILIGYAPNTIKGYDWFKADTTKHQLLINSPAAGGARFTNSKLNVNGDIAANGQLYVNNLVGFSTDTTTNSGPVINWYTNAGWFTIGNGTIPQGSTGTTSKLNVTIFMDSATTRDDAYNYSSTAKDPYFVDFRSNNRAINMPRMNTARMANLTTNWVFRPRGDQSNTRWVGMMLYNTDSSAYCYWGGTSVGWRKIGWNSGGSGGGGQWVSTGSNLSFTSGKVGIGDVDFASTEDYSLAVNGTVLSKKIKVMPQLLATWPDYVFDPSYRLPELAAVEAFVQKYRHLPEVPSAASISSNGLDIGDNQTVLLKKIEELTLYIIQIEKKMKAMEGRIAQVESVVTPVVK